MNDCDHLTTLLDDIDIIIKIKSFEKRYRKILKTKSYNTWILFIK